MLFYNIHNSNRYLHFKTIVIDFLWLSPNRKVCQRRQVCKEWHFILNKTQNIIFVHGLRPNKAVGLRYYNTDFLFEYKKLN